MNEKQARSSSEDRVWHQLEADEVVAHLQTNDDDGLSDDEARRRLERFGPNELTGSAGRSAIRKFIEQFNQPLIYILLIAGVVTLLLREWIDAGVILGVALLNAIIGFVQEAKAEGAIAALARSVTTEATVIRDGEKHRIPSSRLVPGDLVRLGSGDRVPADMRLTWVRNLRVSEASLTGESVPVEKLNRPLAADTPLADRTNMVYAGSYATMGQALGIVVATGDATETGRISGLLEESADLSTPLSIKFRRFSRILLYAILVLAAVAFAVGIAYGDPWVDVFKAAVALAVSAIPEGLPAVVTITLAIGVSRMARRNAIIRSLPAVETLGSTTVICSDKTGTLTRNEMTVQSIYAGGRTFRVSGSGYAPEGEIRTADGQTQQEPDTALRQCLLAGLLCNDTRVHLHEGAYTVTGDPTEAALITAAGKAGLDHRAETHANRRLDTIPFESEQQYMATLHQAGDTRLILVKGSLERLLERCDRMLDAEGNSVDLPREDIEREADAMAARGLRVLALAQKVADPGLDDIAHQHIDGGLVFLGLQGMLDPPRDEAIAAVRSCRSAGIVVKMITGDHAVTAAAIAGMLGLQKGSDRAYTGREIEAMPRDELARAVHESNVFARVAPEQKLRLVEALRAGGEIVAMTGDGVNDAPALKQADIGVAMGQTGTEVAKEASDMILTDDNFASIEGAVEQGRTVYRNLRKAISFILPVNGGESLTILVAVLIGAALPILPVQILWINLLSSVALTIPLAFEPTPPDVMNHPPRNPREALLSGAVLRRTLVLSLMNWMVTFGMFEYVLTTTDNIDVARTMAVQTLVIAEVYYLLSISSLIPATLRRLRGKEAPLATAPLMGIAVVFVLQSLFSQAAIANTLFHTVPLTVTQLSLCLLAASPVILAAGLLRRFDPIR